MKDTNTAPNDFAPRFRAGWPPPSVSDALTVLDALAIVLETPTHLERDDADKGFATTTEAAKNDCMAEFREAAKAVARVAHID